MLDRLARIDQTVCSPRGGGRVLARARCRAPARKVCGSGAWALLASLGCVSPQAARESALTTTGSSPAATRGAGSDAARGSRAVGLRPSGPGAGTTGHRRPASAVTAAAPGDPDAFAWEPLTGSPRGADPADALERVLYEACGRSDGSLARVARRLAARQAAGHPPPDPAWLVYALRAAGSALVWPHRWALAGRHLDPEDAARRIGGWAASFGEGGQKRCGVGTAAGPGGQRVVAGVAAEALAELSPLPTQARLGSWLSVEATLLVGARGAQVLVLAPRGAPRAIPSTFSGGRLRARFAADQPGQWLVQVLADVDTGPRPVLEALVQAGGPPPRAFTESPAPGESAGAGARTEVERLLAMLNEARRSESRPPLALDGALSAVALGHARAMSNTGQLGHDVGDGPPTGRLARAGLGLELSGENVARSSSLRGAHRTLWASPAHRGNLLDRRFQRVGVGIVHDGAVVWVCLCFGGAP